MTATEKNQEPRKKQRLEGSVANPTASAGPVDAPGMTGPTPHTPSAASSGRRRLVLVWDIDETLIIFNSLLSGTWAAAQQQRGDPAAVARLLDLGARWEAAILRLCDERFFFGELEEFDQTCLADIQAYDDGASLGGYRYTEDSFPPPGQHHTHTAQQHAATAHPAAYAAPAAAGAGGGVGNLSSQVGAASYSAPAFPQQQQQQQGENSSSLDSPASRSLDAGSLTKLAYRFRRIALLYKFGLAALGSAPQRQEWESLYAETEELTNGWLTHASALLAGCTAQLASGGLGSGGSGSGTARNSGAGTGSGSPHGRGLAGRGPAGGGLGGGGLAGGGPAGEAPEIIHVAVTSGQLIPSLAKLLLFQLSGQIQAEHVWSSRFRGKRHCFEAVRQRFGPACTYVAIGDGMEEDEAAAALGWPYIRVLLAPAGHYPADTVLSWRPDAATSGPGLPLTELTVQHLGLAAGLERTRPPTPAEGAHGGSAAVAALGGAEGVFIECL